MSTLLLSILGLSIGIEQCSVWREIAPCLCQKETSRIIINCEKMSSYAEVVNTLQNKFLPTDRIVLRIGWSTLLDLPQRNFKELNMSIENVQLNHDNLSELSASSFVGLNNVNYFSLSDSNIGIVPRHILQLLPSVKTLDLGRVGITELTEESFKTIPNVQNVMLGGNLISKMEITSLPSHLHQLHLGRNRIRDLNGTLTNLTDLEWLFINANELTDLENQLPRIAPRLNILHAGNNKIQKLPQRLKSYGNLQSLFLNNNLITSLDGVLSKSRKLERAQFEYNKINSLTSEDFVETESLQCLCMGNNELTSLNNSIRPLKSLSVLNVTYNLFSEFSFQEIKGFRKLRTVDLSHNKIFKLLGFATNLIDFETKITELYLNNNDLYILNGALSGLSSLLKLDISFNKLLHIAPGDLIGLDELQFLDVSHNQLTTLEETGKSFLPSLSELVASYNYLTILQHDLYGLPVLCSADFSNNKIVALGRDLIGKTRCKIQDTLGTLKIILQDNPILCDAALPEIVAAMEINHTRIVGVSHCGPLSEQPTTSKPNAFLGFIPEDIDGYRVNISFKQQMHKDKSVLYNNGQSSHNQLKISSNIEPLRTLIINKASTENDQRLINQDERYEPLRPTSEPNNNIDIATNQQSSIQQQGSFAGQNINSLATVTVFKPKQVSPNEEKAQRDEMSLEQILSEQPIIMPQQQLNQLTSEIQQLKLQVHELTVQNKVLSQSINVPFDNNETRLFENQDITPKQVEIHMLYPEKSPDKLDKSTR